MNIGLYGGDSKLFLEQPAIGDVLDGAHTAEHPLPRREALIRLDRRTCLAGSRAGYGEKAFEDGGGKQLGDCWTEARTRRRNPGAMRVQ